MSASAPPADVEVDALGLLCPLPVLRAEQAARRLRPGQVLAVLADDPAARGDLAAWCEGRGHELVAVSDLPGLGGKPGLRALVRLGGAPPEA